MKPFTIHKGLAVPLLEPNLDTDRIIPKQFLKSIRRTGFGPNLFDDMRYEDTGYPGQDLLTRKPRKDFVLNQPRYENASVLITGANFGCGSSREHAVWALMDFGIRAVIAPSFADIFFINCAKNGLLPIELDESTVVALAAEVEKNEGYELEVDLPAQRVATPTGVNYSFAIDDFRKNAFLKGLDDIGITLQSFSRIKKFEKSHRERFPWLFDSLSS